MSVGEDKDDIHVVASFPDQGAVLQGMKWASSWIKVDAGAAMAALYRAKWEHLVTYGLVGEQWKEMEAEGWEIAGAWKTGRPDEDQPYFVWKRPRTHL